jgi:hypothetical protein
VRLAIHSRIRISAGVSVSVGTLTQNECDEALCAGINVAEQFVRSGAIVAAILCLQGQVRSVGEFELSALAGDNKFLVSR